MQNILATGVNWQWVDVVAPSADELVQLAQTYKIHPVLLEDCLDPEHLPKYEVIPDCLFTILRIYDVNAASDALTVQQLTRKLVVVMVEGTLLTIHRAPLRFLQDYSQSLQRVAADLSQTNLYYEICKTAIMTYDLAFLAFEQRFESFEAKLDQGKVTFEVFVQIRQEARRLSTIKRLLWHTLAIFQRLPRLQESEKLYAHDLVESVQSLMFFADELADDASKLINLELSLNTHRNNQTIRILTLFSVVFMPLTFIVGVYGMNFRYIPELAWHYGYPAVWLLMLVIVVLLGVWFKKRQWLDS